jgi:hypothetical protein
MITSQSSYDHLTIILQPYYNHFMIILQPSYDHRYHLTIMLHSLQPSSSNNFMIIEQL